MSRIRIIVADQAEAIFYDTASLRARPKEVARISDPLAHQHNRDFASDRPGRSYESFGGARHAIARENDPRQQEAVRFAKRISRRLDAARRSGEFDELIVVAGPAFLGLMRPSCRSRPAPGWSTRSARTSCTARSRRCGATCRSRRKRCIRPEALPTSVRGRARVNCDGSRAVRGRVGACCRRAHTWRPPGNVIPWR